MFKLEYFPLSDSCYHAKTNFIFYWFGNPKYELVHANNINIQVNTQIPLEYTHVTEIDFTNSVHT